MRRRPLLVAAAVAMLAAACGSAGSDAADAPTAAADAPSPDTPTAAAPSPTSRGVATAGTVDPAAARAAADANIGDLAGSDDVRLIEVLNVADGSVATLSDAVWGDRPVLLWFWAPH